MKIPMCSGQARCIPTGVAAENEEACTITLATNPASDRRRKTIIGAPGKDLIVERVEELRCWKSAVSVIRTTAGRVLRWMGLGEVVAAFGAPLRAGAEIVSARRAEPRAEASVELETSERKAQ